MTKLIAIVNVIAWSGFWAFGYLAMSARVEDTSQMVTAAILAAIGGAIGLWAYFKLIRHTEDTGYAKRPNRAMQEETRDVVEWGMG
ncbi:hypothetical protein [Pseudoprimorskyibacter insulae]|uniref:Uncharacterized protein n=1 Tax=Pseudoprimorskyibacter insulae TaxID=1695997 RepID=A0A2R8AUQ8_9RHOB|nr:hypothetical protein [Pseudoprimorskyibacter insulae]SPF79785.1 hypothetical protein PRI8871_01582 [Pseudoprimorskyibacter insulae]